MANSAVIVNEFGEVPLDHELLAASEEVLVNVSTLAASAAWCAAT